MQIENKFIQVRLIILLSFKRILIVEIYCFLDSAWNQWLFDKIGSEIFQWIKELVTDNKFRFQAYRLIPSRLNLANNILSKRFNESFEMAVKHCNFILNRTNQLLRVSRKNRIEF
jgi:hypothetical protein